MPNTKKATNKNNFKSNFAFVIISIIVALLIATALFIGVFKWLNKYTEHGVEVEVPYICGTYTQEAEILLQARGLKMEIIDSTYTNKVPLGTIVEQNPQAGAHAKHGRPIYVIMNANAKKSIPLPDLHDISYRQAIAMIEALGLKVDSIHYEPSIYRDLVLDIQLEGKSLEAGTRIEEGTAIDLVIGQGEGTEQTYVPNLIGKTIAEAREMLLGSHLIAGALNYDELADTLNVKYFIYEQSPSAGTWIVEGSRIDFTLTADSIKVIKKLHNADEEEFF